MPVFVYTYWPVMAAFEIVVCNNRLADEHSVTITEKAIAFRNRFRVAFHDEIFARKSGNKHEKRGFGSMEVCKEGIYYLKLVTWIDEDRCGTFPWGKVPVCPRRF